MFASDIFATNGLSLLFNPYLFLNKFREIEPDKMQFPKFSLPTTNASAPNQQQPSSSSSHLDSTVPPPPALLQTKEFYDSLDNLLKRTMPETETGTGEQSSLLTRLYLCENPFEDFVAIVENQLRDRNKHQQQNQRQQNSPNMMMKSQLNDKWINTSLTISALMASERRIHGFNSTTRKFKDGFLEQFDSLKEFLQFVGSIISNPDQYTEPFQIESDESTMYTAQNLIALLLMDFVTFIELFKMMPVFCMLESDDQVCLVNNLAVTLVGFCERYHSSRWKTDTVVKLSNGFSPIFVFHKNSKFAGEERKVELVYCKSMRPFNKQQLSIEEYLLLRAILMSHSAFSGLSMIAKRLLQKEAERYAHSLLQFLQSQHGELAGAQRYADLLVLLEDVLHIAAKHRMVHSHLADKVREEEANVGGAMSGDDSGRSGRRTTTALLPPAAFMAMFAGGEQNDRADVVAVDEEDSK